MRHAHMFAIDVRITVFHCSVQTRNNRKQQQKPANRMVSLCAIDANARSPAANGLRKMKECGYTFLCASVVWTIAKRRNSRSNGATHTDAIAAMLCGLTEVQRISRTDWIMCIDVTDTFVAARRAVHVIQRISWCRTHMRQRHTPSRCIRTFWKRFLGRLWPLFYALDQVKSYTRINWEQRAPYTSSVCKR